MRLFSEQVMPSFANHPYKDSVNAYHDHSAV
jgi:hypothetical protein